MVSLLNLIIEKLNTVNSVLFFSGLFLVIALLCNHYSNRALSYFFFYSSLMYTYFFFLLSLNISPSLLTYGFYFIVFISYHFYFTFSKRYYLRTIVIIRKYLNNKEYVKLVLWSYFVLLCSLIGNKFVFLGVFNPLLLFSMANSNMTFALFLIILWSWMFILIFCNEFKIYTNFLLCIQNFFSREACLHYIGANPGKMLC